MEQNLYETPSPEVTYLTSLGIAPEWVVPVILLFVAWSLVWKGYALWLSARNTHKWWFVILLVVNTIGILEIIYIFVIGRKERAAQLQNQGSQVSSPAP